VAAKCFAFLPITSPLPSIPVSAVMVITYSPHPLRIPFRRQKSCHTVSITGGRLHMTPTIAMMASVARAVFGGESHVQTGVFGLIDLVSANG
jgi:hypothetical protein